MKYSHLYADADGVSHIEDKKLSSSELDFMPPAPPVQISTTQSVENLILMGVPADWEETDRHPAPACQWVFILHGQIEFIASDGNSRVLGPGGILLAEDISGEGHTSRIYGNAEALLAVVKRAK